MKKLFRFLAVGALLVLSFSCSSDILEDQTDLGRFSVLEVFVDKSQTNQYSHHVFCHEWGYATTQKETWVDGTMTEMEEIDNILPYKSLDLRENWGMKAWSWKSHEMNGFWLYSYNHLFIDCLGDGGGNYVYQVVEVTPDKLVVREEDYPIGVPIAPNMFHNNPSGKHTFIRFTYLRK